MNPKFWWYLTRASGLVAAVLIALTVIWGLLLATKLIDRRGLPAWLLDLHRMLGGLSVTFVGVHLLSLWADSFVDFGWRELFVPFASTWRPGPVAWGIVALWGLIAIEGTSLVQRRMPRRWWRAVHLLAYPVAVLVGLHAITAGTDVRNPAFLVGLFGAVCTLVFLVAYRQLRPAPMTTSRRVGRPAGSSPVTSRMGQPEMITATSETATSELVTPGSR
jgi:DMSO/TMAO reductase YedYZ heme-binding membrane subunit